mgnify:CR=1 FL=1
MAPDATGVHCLRHNELQDDLVNSILRNSICRDFLRPYGITQVETVSLCRFCSYYLNLGH